MQEAREEEKDEERSKQEVTQERRLREVREERKDMWRESEEEDGGREVPPRIVVEREKEEKEDRKRTDNLVARVQKLEGQMREMHQKKWEATSFTQAVTEEENASLRCEGAGGGNGKDGRELGGLRWDGRT